MIVDLTQGDPIWPELTSMAKSSVRSKKDIQHIPYYTIWIVTVTSHNFFCFCENCFTHHSVFYPPFEVKVQSTSEFVGKLRGVYPSMEFGGAIHKVNLNEKELQKQNDMKFIGVF